MSDMIRLMFLMRAGFLTGCLATLQPVNAAQTGSSAISRGDTTYRLYPATFKERPDLPSPYRAEDGLEVLTVRTEQKDYALIPVTITPGITVRPWEAPLEIDREDFPTLAKTGRHSETELDRTRSITGRSLAEITELGRPGRLSSSGFMAEDEDVLCELRRPYGLADRPHRHSLPVRAQTPRGDRGRVCRATAPGADAALRPGTRQGRAEHEPAGRVDPLRRLRGLTHSDGLTRSQMRDPRPSISGQTL